MGRMSSLCTADTGSGDCFNQVMEGAPLALCQLHLLMAAEFVKSSTGTVIDRMNGVPKNTARPPGHKPQVVYYLRFGELIKIGTTTDLPKRLMNVPHDELLAVEPGGNAVELYRHRQFKSTRRVREWFNPSTELIKHISDVRRKCGPPAKAWEKFASKT